MKCQTGFLAVVLFLLSGLVSAQVPQTLSYQGFLASGGIPVPDGKYSLTFRLFDVLSGGSALWTESDTGISVANGAFSVVLGSSTPLSGVNFDQQLFIEVQEGVNPPFSPRSPLTSSPS